MLPVLAIKCNYRVVVKNYFNRLQKRPGKLTKIVFFLKLHWGKKG